MHVCNTVYVSCGRHSSQPVEIAGFKNQDRGFLTHITKEVIKEHVQYAGMISVNLGPSLPTLYSLHSIEAVLRRMN
jgi:hypothetical protein